MAKEASKDGEDSKADNRGSKDGEILEVSSHQDGKARVDSKASEEVSSSKVGEASKEDKVGDMNRFIL